LVSTTTRGQPGGAPKPSDSPPRVLAEFTDTDYTGGLFGKKGWACCCLHESPRGCAAWAGHSPFSSTTT
jgi:hypothetical protein